MQIVSLETHTHTHTHTHKDKTPSIIKRAEPLAYSNTLTFDLT